MTRTSDSDPGFFSSARAFAPALGERVGSPERPRGYHIDFSAKAEAPSWPPPWLPPPEEELYVSAAQWALGAWERYVAGEGEEWRRGALVAADHLLANQQDGGPLDGAFLHRSPMPHTFPLDPPWASAITQGEAASLFVRLQVDSGEERFAEAARRALAPMLVPTADGGCLATVGNEPFYEEYPTDPSSLVLNGAIFALLGFHDVARALDDGAATDSFERGVAGLIGLLDRYDTGHWSRYDLYPHPVPNIASSAYHLLHITLLTALDRVYPRAELRRTRDRFELYRASRLDRRRAFAQKVAFRLVIPRNRLLARRLPWDARPPRAPADG